MLKSGHLDVPELRRSLDSTPPGDLPSNSGLLAPDAAIRYTVLGPLKVWVGQQEWTPTTPKVLQVFALLLLRANQAVQTDSLIHELWGESPPRSALTTLQTYVYQLRRLMVRAGIAGSGNDMLATLAPGYLLRLEPSQLDLTHFDQLVRAGRENISRGKFTEGASDMRTALRIGTAAPLSNVRLGAQLSAYVTGLQETRRNAIQMVIEAEMELGQHRELIAELNSLIATYPLDEWFYQQLMIALSRCGRRGEAMQVYHRLRTVLNTELGIDPSDDTQHLYRTLLD